MPKRSNEFQKLVFLVKKHAGENATVTESKMLADRVDGKEREVDICIESRVGDDEIIICVECTDPDRPADVMWVEQKKAKHEHLPTHKLILASRSGLTEDAEKRAHFYGMDTISLDEFDEEDANTMFSGLEKLISRTYTLEPTSVVVRLTLRDGSQVGVKTHPNNLLFDPSGNELGTVKEMVEVLGRSEHVAREVTSKGTKEHKGFEITWDPVISKDGSYPYTMRLEETKELQRLEALCINGSCDFEISEFALRRATLGSVSVSWGRGTFLGKTSLAVASAGKLSIQIGDPGKAVGKRSKRRRRKTT